MNPAIADKQPVAAARPRAKDEHRWHEAVDEHREALAAFLDTAESLDADAWRQPWSAGKWTRAQIAEHLALTYEVLIDELVNGKAMAPRASPWMQRVLRWVLLPHILFHRSFPLRARAPREIRPGDRNIPQAELLPRLRRAAERFEAELERARHAGRGHVTSPYFGVVDPLRTLRFCAVHLEHHRRQVAPRA